MARAPALHARVRPVLPRSARPPVRALSGTGVDRTADIDIRFPVSGDARPVRGRVRHDAAAGHLGDDKVRTADRAYEATGAQTAIDRLGLVVEWRCAALQLLRR